MTTPITDSLTDNSTRDNTGDAIGGAEVDANPIKITNILDGSVETALNMDGDASSGLAIHNFEATNRAAAAGGVQTVLRVRYDPVSGTAADNDGVQLLFEGDDDGGTKTTFGALQLLFTDVSDTTEDGRFVFRAQKAGTLTSMGYLDGTGLGIGTAPSAPLHIASGNALQGLFNAGTNDIAASFRSSDAGAYVDFQDNTTTGDGYVQVGASGDSLILKGGNAAQIAIDADNFLFSVSGTAKFDIQAGATASIYNSQSRAANSGAAVILLDLYNTGATAVGTISRLSFSAKDSGGTETRFAYLDVNVADNTDTSEDADWIFRQLVAGVMTINFQINANGSISVPNIPTSSAGLSSGDVWANSNVLTVVP